MIEALLWGIGLVLVIEGMVYAIFPMVIDNLLQALKDLPVSARRRFGTLTALLGAVILLAVSRYFS